MHFAKLRPWAGVRTPPHQADHHAAPAPRPAVEPPRAQAELRGERERSPKHEPGPLGPGGPAVCAPTLSRAKALPPASNSCTSCLKCRTETDRKPQAVAAKCAAHYRLR